MKDVKSYTEELLTRWLHEDFRNPESELFIAKITGEQVERLINAASESVAKIINEELDSARTWYYAQTKEVR